VAKTRISSTDLLWIFQERLASFDRRLKVAPLAIISSKNSWEVVTSPRYRKSEPQLARYIKKIQAELQPVYSLAVD
jgi:hypothetical protein